jgi:1-phosphofructokinase
MPPRSEDICVVSPSPLISVTIESAASGEDEVHFHAAGQGVWIARMIARLGARPLLCAPIGGESGAVLRSLLTAEEIELHASSTHQPNGVYVHDRRRGERVELSNVASAAFTRHELDDFYTLAFQKGLETGVAVLTGPTHKNVLDAETIGRLARDLAANDVELVADVSRETLRALRATLAWLKVSHEELIDEGLAASGRMDDIARGALVLVERGARNVIVSRAHEPSLAWLESRFVEVRTPQLESRDHHGAGDCMTAALATSVRRQMAPEDALRLAAAAGALNVTRHGLGTGRRDAIEAFARHIDVVPFEP